MPKLPHRELFLKFFWFVSIYLLLAKPASAFESQGKRPILPSVPLGPCCHAYVCSPFSTSSASAGVLVGYWCFLSHLPFLMPLQGEKWLQGSLLPTSDSLFLFLKFCISELNLHLIFLIQQHLQEQYRFLE